MLQRGDRDERHTRGGLALSASGGDAPSQSHDSHREIAAPRFHDAHEFRPFQTGTNRVSWMKRVTCGRIAITYRLGGAVL